MVGHQTTPHPRLIALHPPISVYFSLCPPAPPRSPLPQRPPRVSREVQAAAGGNGRSALRQKVQARQSFRLLREDDGCADQGEKMPTVLPSVLASAGRCNPEGGCVGIESGDVRVQHHRSTFTAVDAGLLRLKLTSLAPRVKGWRKPYTA